MAKLVSFGLVLLLLCVAPAGAEDGEDAEMHPALTYDGVNTPLEKVVAKATATNRPIFLEFFADG